MHGPKPSLFPLICVWASATMLPSKAAASSRRLADETPTPASASITTLTWCLISVLWLGAFALLALLPLIYAFRNSPPMKASQPAGLALIATAGASALVGGCFLVAPPSDVTCAVAEPLVFSSVTVVGASLAGMAWRVERVASPVLALGRGDGRRDGARRDAVSVFHRTKGGLVNVLTLLSCSRGTRLNNRQARNLRQTVDVRSLVRLVGALSSPQIVMQALNASLTALRRSPSDTAFDPNVCMRPSGAWWTVATGTILAVLPSLSALVVTSMRKVGATIPPMLSLDHATQTTFGVFAIASISVVPILAFEDAGADVSTYILIYLLLAAVMPPAYLVIWTKLFPLLTSNSEGIADLTVAIRSTLTHPLNNQRHSRAIEALEQGRIFDEWEMPDKSRGVYNDALNSWERDDIRTRRFTGDFSTQEIRSFGGRDSEVIVRLLVAKAARSESPGAVYAAECYLKAIEIFEFAPSVEFLRERSAVYPCFHSLFRLLREGRLDRDTAFERALAARFVQESKGTKDYHYACALAYNAEMKMRSGSTEEALKELETMAKIYGDGNDSRAIYEASGLDVCALAFSRSVLWYTELGDQSNASKQCEFVIGMLQGLGSMDANEIHAILMPVIVFFICNRVDMGRLKSLHFLQVAGRARDSAMPFSVRIMLLVLTLSGNHDQKYKWMGSDIDWILSDETKQVSQESDYFYLSLGMSINTLAAEACFHLAQKRGSSSPRLIDKGLAFATVASRNIKENADMICTVANARNKELILSLHALADEIGLDSLQDCEMQRIDHVSFGARRRNALKYTLSLRTKNMLPHQLLLKHDTVAFVGLTHHSLATAFEKAIAEEPGRVWKNVYICYEADWRLAAFISRYTPNAEAEADALREEIVESKSALFTLLRDRVSEQLNFYEIKDHCFFGSWFGWRNEGGYIHVSPSIWGVDVKMCPSQGLTWEPGIEPPPDYNAYRQGIENILESASPFSTLLDVHVSA